MTIDLNCDMGELADAAHEAALMAYVTSANIACGGHAGDDEMMERTARLALERGVRIGAHPGYPDRENFGRVEMPMSRAEIADSVYGQILRLEEIVTRLGGTIEYVKPLDGSFTRERRLIVAMRTNSQSSRCCVAVTRA